MQNDKITLYSLSFNESKSYLLTASFVAGNILLPQLCHLIPQGGLRLLPIYLFTLIGGYKYGWRVGVATALISPIANHLLCGMPTLEVLPLILIKSITLAFAAAFAAQRLRRLPLVVALAAVVISYQAVGTIAEWAIEGDLVAALQRLQLGVLGMVVQIFGCELLFSRLLRR